jgi:hypothetical protein
MSDGIEITPEQAVALARLSESVGAIAIHQLAAAHGSDVYATPRGTDHGYRIRADGTVSEMGETLPAPD